MERSRIINRVKDIATSNEAIATTTGVFSTLEGFLVAKNVTDGNIGLAVFFGICGVLYAKWTINGATREINKIKEHLGNRRQQLPS